MCTCSAHGGRRPSSSVDAGLHVFVCAAEPSTRLATFIRISGVLPSGRHIFGQSSARHRRPVSFWNSKSLEKPTQKTSGRFMGRTKVGLPTAGGAAPGCARRCAAVRGGALRDSAGRSCSGGDRPKLRRKPSRFWQEGAGGWKPRWGTKSFHHLQTENCRGRCPPLTGRTEPCISHGPFNHARHQQNTFLLAFGKPF